MFILLLLLLLPVSHPEAAVIAVVDVVGRGRLRVFLHLLLGLLLRLLLLRLQRHELLNLRRHESRLLSLGGRTLALPNVVLVGIA